MQRAASLRQCLAEAKSKRDPQEKQESEEQTNEPSKNRSSIWDFGLFDFFRWWFHRDGRLRSWDAVSSGVGTRFLNTLLHSNMRYDALRGLERLEQNCTSKSFKKYMKYFKVENARSQACTARPFRKGACLVALRKMKRCLLSGCFTTSGKLSGSTKFYRRQIPDCPTTSGISVWSKDLSIESADTSLSKVNWVFWKHFRLHVLKGTGNKYAGSISQLKNSQLNNLPEGENKDSNFRRLLFPCCYSIPFCKHWILVEH